MIDDLFGGSLRSTVVCLTCGGVSCSRESFLDLSLPIPRRSGWEQSKTNGASESAAVHDVEGAAVPASAVLAKLPADLSTPHTSGERRLVACLQAFAAPEVLQGEDAYVCDACRKAEEKPAAQSRQPAVKWLQIARVPRVLTLHLKRFRSMGRRVHKLDDPVPFPALLDLSAFTCEPGEPVSHFSKLGGAAALQKSAPMRLYGVVEHQGNFSGGHYIAYVRIGDCWYRMNDSIVTCVREEEVLAKQAFLLFYERDGHAA